MGPDPPDPGAAPVERTSLEQARHLLRRMVEHDTVRFALLVALAAFLADWASKSWALERVTDGTLPFGGLTLGVVRNDAFAFSLGAERTHLLLVLGVRLTALAAIVWLCRHIVYLLSYRNACGFALVLAGGFGNAADLLFRDGAVVDFIGAGPFLVTWDGSPTWIYPVFNTADLFILLGIGLLGPLVHESSRTIRERIVAWERRWIRRRSAPGG